MQASRSLILASRLLVCALPALAASHVLAQTTGSATVHPAPPTAAKSEDASDSVLVIVDGQLVDAEAVEIKRATQIMVWLRDLERLGWGTVEAGPGDEIRFKGASASLQFQKNGGIARVNSLAVRLPIDTYLKDGKLMVPLSFVAKALGFEYETSTKTVATVRTTQPRYNSISGRVTYNGRGEQGIVVRAVDAHYVAVKNVKATTDEQGRFTLSPLPDGEFTHQAIEERLRAAAAELGLKAGQMFQPIRVAVCGRKNAPPLFETLEVVGREACLERIGRAIELLKRES